MYAINRILFAVLLVTVAVAQSPDPPLSDSRFTVHTLLREDIFAGFLADDMERFSRAEKNIEILLEKRPDQRANLLSWKGGAALYRAVRALEDKQADQFQQHYRRALGYFSEAESLGSGNDGVAAVMGGSYVLFADRLPKENQAAAWSKAYDSFLFLWKLQGPIVDKLPVHLRGELLGGLAQAAQRTGRTKEMQEYLDKILTVLPGSPYEPIAKQWKKNPESAAAGSITCLTCHNPGRLADRIAVIEKK